MADVADTNFKRCVFLDGSTVSELCSLTDDQSCLARVFNPTTNQRSFSSCIFDRAVMDVRPSLVTALYANTPACFLHCLGFFFISFLFSLSAFISMTDHHTVPPSAFIHPLVSLLSCSLFSALKHSKYLAARMNIQLDKAYQLVVSGCQERQCTCVIINTVI